MFKELNKLINIPIKYTEIQDKKKLPVYLATRSLFKASADGLEFIIVVFPKESKFDVRQLRKQLGLYQKAFNSYVAFAFDVVSRHQRDALIDNQIPFVSLPELVYLPFLGVLLQKKFSADNTIATDKFTPAAQMLFLLLAYSKDCELISKGRAAEIIAVTNTTLTRASAQLKAMGLLQEEQHGTTMFICKSSSGRDYLDKGLPYMINPVQDVVYVRPTPEIEKLPDSGEYALSNISMLNTPAVRSKACRMKRTDLDKLSKVDPLLESEINYVRLESWRYSPEVFAANGNVDDISLYCSFNNETDERIEEALENVLEGHKWV